MIKSPLKFILCVSLVLFSTGYAQDDPFADVAIAPASETTGATMEARWSDNLLWRKEVYLLLGAGRDTFAHEHGIMSRSSAGFEVQKRFATATRTVAIADYQGRIVYRNRWLDTLSDQMGHGENAWKYETHNAYVDLYDVFGEPGRFSLRLGNFYQPFGLAQQTDTHATLMQLSNDMVLGAGHDWQATLHGNLSENLDYAFGYLAGTGHDHKLEGQTGMGVARVLLSNDWLFKQGLEGGLSFAAGERVDPHAAMRSSAVGRSARSGSVVKGWRGGADLRKRLDSRAGPFTLTGEAALGEDKDDLLAAGLAQADWLHPGRRWGTALQYRHFWQDLSHESHDWNEARAAGAITRYFKNEVSSANMHWIALAVERVVHHTEAPRDTMVLLQYYRYW